MTQPTLRTDRIRLDPLSIDHLPYAVELDSDPEVMRYLGNGRPNPRERAEAEHRARVAVADRAPGLGFWAGFVEEEFVGWWALGSRPAAPDQAELGYRLLRRHWRRGLASEGALELIRYGFEELGLDRIFAETMAVNVASRATMAAVGLRPVRTFHLDWDEPIPGSEHGEVEYALTRERWLTR